MTRTAHPVMPMKYPDACAAILLLSICPGAYCVERDDLLGQSNGRLPAACKAEQEMILPGAARREYSIAVVACGSDRFAVVERQPQGEQHREIVQATSLALKPGEEFMMAMLCTDQGHVHESVFGVGMWQAADTGGYFARLRQAYTFDKAGRSLDSIPVDDVSCTTDGY